MMLRKIFLTCVISLLLAIQSITSIQAAGTKGTPKDNSGLGSLQTETIEIPLGNKVILKDGTPVKEVFNSTNDMVGLIVKVLFIGAGLVLFFIIIVAGFSLIKGESKDKDQAKTQITGALVGFLIMFAAYWIMQIIQLITGVEMGFQK